MNKRIEILKHPNHPRRMFIVDIENAIGCGVISDDRVKQQKYRIEETYGCNEDDLVVIGVSHSKNAFPARCWKGARIVLKHGENGADLALKRVMQTEDLASRFGEVVIVSGDGIFAKEAKALKQEGARVLIDSALDSVASKMIQMASIANMHTSTNKVYQLRLTA